MSAHPSGTCVGPSDTERSRLTWNRSYESPKSISHWKVTIILWQPTQKPVIKQALKVTVILPHNTRKSVIHQAMIGTAILLKREEKVSDLSDTEKLLYFIRVSLHNLHHTTFTTNMKYFFLQHKGNIIRQLFLSVSVCLSLSACLSVCLSVCLSPYPFRLEVTLCGWGNLEIQELTNSLCVYSRQTKRQSVLKRCVLQLSVGPDLWL